mmetsp:Transcript_17552/g.43491  ORF Transcript_17552/g.43491 Transcript_17552/m.43491 type:complete len:239 (-) Transcript_17552:483-1199(-)
MPASTVSLPGRLLLRPQLHHIHYFRAGRHHRRAVLIYRAGGVVLLLGAGHGRGASHGLVILPAILRFHVLVVVYVHVLGSRHRLLVLAVVSLVLAVVSLILRRLNRRRILYLLVPCDASLGSFCGAGGEELCVQPAGGGQHKGSASPEHEACVGVAPSPASSRVARRNTTAHHPLLLHSYRVGGLYSSRGGGGDCHGFHGGSECRRRGNGYVGAAAANPGGVRAALSVRASGTVGVGG